MLPLKLSKDNKAASGAVVESAKALKKTLSELSPCQKKRLIGKLAPQTPLDDRKSGKPTGEATD